jgi:hypothetical protein
MESSVKRVTDSFEKKLDDKVAEMSSFQEMVSMQINKLQTDVPKADAATSKAPKKKKRAVLRGRSLGLYQSWGEARLEVDDYPGGFHMVFKSETKDLRSLAAGAND